MRLQNRYLHFGVAVAFKVGLVMMLCAGGSDLWNEILDF